MSVILNMEMPKSCMACPFARLDADPPHCLISNTPYEEYFDIFHLRMPDCPLTKVTETKEYLGADRCVCCGEIVPEGTQVCNNCLKKFMD